MEVLAVNQRRYDPLRGHPAAQRGVVAAGRRRGHPQRGDQLRGEPGGQRAAVEPAEEARDD